MKVRNEIYELISSSIIQTGFEYDLEVIDNSYKHVGHVGYNDEGESHFKVEISSDFFKDMNKVKRHRIIFEWLGDVVTEKIHALEISVKSRDE